MTISWKSLVASFAILILLAGSAAATPDQSSNCTGCHSRTAGAFNFSPSSLLQLPIGTTRGLTINQTSTGDTNWGSALSLTGLNQSGLGATADASWTHRTSGGDRWTLGPYTTATLPVAKSLNLTPVRCSQGQLYD